MDQGIWHEKPAAEARQLGEPFSRLAVGVFLLDSSLAILDANAEAQRLLGYRLEELQAFRASDLLHPVDKGQLSPDRAFEELVNGELLNLQRRYRCRSGSYLPVQVNLIRFHDQAEAYLAVFQDLSSCKYTDRHRAILESIGEGYFEADLQGNILFFNEALREILGYPEWELYGLNYREFSPPKTVKRLQETLNRIYRTRKPARLAEYVIYSKSGAERILEISAYPMEDYQENIEGFRGVVRDMTEKRRIEEEKAQLEHQLRQAQRLEAVGTLAAGVAHEFNNLLQGVYGSIQLLLFKKKADDPECRHLYNIEKLIERGKEVVSGLLTFSRKQQLKFEAVDANKIVENTLSFLRSALPKSISLQLDLSRNAPRILADPIQFEQILVNLINNAEHALASQDGGEIIISTSSHVRRQNDLHPDLTPGSYFRIAVRDNGPGMTREQQEHIFDPFYTTKEPGEGTGLGLSTIYNIVKGHNGHIQCSSHPGKGTEFSIDLPALELGADESAGAEASQTAATLCRGRETVLLVEDEAAIREFLQELLQSCGYKVLLAANGEEALTLEAGHEGPIDLILLDLGMPGMSGEQFLKQRAEARGRKIILISGYDSTRINKALKDFQIDGAVRKPFHLESFLATIRKVLDAP